MRMRIRIVAALGMALFLSMSLVASAVTVQNELISSSTGGTAADKNSYLAVLSSSGRYVVFMSSGQLVPEKATSRLDVYRRDRLGGGLQLVSVSSTGQLADADCTEPSVDGSGMRIAFLSSSHALTPAAGPFPLAHAKDVFVRDVSGGTTVRASVTSTGGLQDGGVYNACISPGGGQVAFESDAVNLVPGQTKRERHIYLRDLGAGTTEQIDVGAGGAANMWSYLGFIHTAQSVSTSGRFVVFESVATNLVSGDTNGRMDVFIRDRISRKTERVSVSTAGAQSKGVSHYPAISADGRYVAFVCEDPDLVPGSSTSSILHPQVYVRDREKKTTERVSVSTRGYPGAGTSSFPGISADGRYVVFQSDAPALVPGYSRHNQIYVRDRYRRTTQLESPANGGAGTPGTGASTYPAISVDGSVVAFESEAPDLVTDDASGKTDVFARKVVEAPQRVTVSPPAVPTSAKKNRAFSVSGTLSPRHPSISHPVKVYGYRLEKKKWVKRAEVTATLSDDRSGSTYTASVTLPSAGSWRLKAYYSGIWFPKRWSAQSATVKVK